jgi:SEC-C motif
LNRPGRSAKFPAMPSDTAIMPADVRQRLEEARLDNLALMRALDRVYRDGPPIAEAILRAWYELEADCVEGLWALDQPPGRLDRRAMVRDTLASLGRLAAARDRVRAALPAMEREILVRAEEAIRAALDPTEAYSQVAGRDPEARKPKALPVKATGPRVRSNDPCPCGSGKKYKRCCAPRSPAGATQDKSSFRFEPGSYGGRGSFAPSISCTKVTGAQSHLHFVLVNADAVHEREDAAVEEATRDLDDAFSGGGDPERVALHLRDTGYLQVDDPRMAVD